MDQEAFFTSPLREYFTMRDMAAAIGVPLATVKHAIEQFHLPAARRHGVVRLWDAGQARALRRLLETRG